MLIGLKELFEIIGRPDVINETSSDLRIKISKSELLSIGYNQFLHTRSYEQFCSLFTVHAEGEVNRLLVSKYKDQTLSEGLFEKIDSVEFIIDKSKLGLNEHEAYYYDLDYYFEKALKYPDEFQIIYNNFLSIDGPVKFIKIDDLESNNYQSKELHDVHFFDFRNSINNYDVRKEAIYNKVVNFMDYLSVVSTLSFLTEYKSYNGEITLKGEKEIKFNSVSIEDCSLDNDKRMILKSINSLLNDSDPHLKDKKHILLKVITLYLSDDASVKDFINKIHKIYPKFADSVDNYIDKKVENYFDNHNKLIEEVIKTSNKVTEETNKSMTQMLTLITTVLASLFVYIYKKDTIDLNIFLSVLIIFLAVTTLVLIFNHVSNLRYYNGFIDNYFEVINHLYSFKESEKEIRDNLLTPAIKRYKKALIVFASILITFIIIGIGVLCYRLNIHMLIISFLKNFFKNTN